eukprot:CAMPEP_0117664854 /NCGR_PEP_ID=MMETSP0804-20121206/9465_1 /TAXON_ID=1074897 /ORGANISM="Tetraselmis astigmatica, Strain CCMP880" /LENGTH=152 /DNA_ID=CAMNT_0005472161 /DNA_START=270 /DNA_END=728 /DNA_ORIENTATION=+
MPRRSAKPAPRPAARAPSSPPSQPRGYSSSSTTAPPRPQSPPPPAHASPAAPPPATSSGGGSMLGSMVGMVGQGMALGTGSAIAHRAVDSMMGSRDSGSSAPAPAAPVEVPTEGPCSTQAKAFSECMSENFGDMNACQQYFENMQACKRAFA